MQAYRSSQLLASTDSGFSLTDHSRALTLYFSGSSELNSLMESFKKADFQSRYDLSLRFENLKGNDSLPIIDVYLNLADEQIPQEDHYVGSMALYGLGESSEETEKHPGSGQDRVFDIGSTFTKVMTRTGSEKQLKLTLIPERALPAHAVLTIGKVSLYWHEK